MLELNCVKPGAKPGQVILCVNLSKAGNIETTLEVLTELGYKPELRHISLKSGVQVFAVIKDEQHEKGVAFNYLMDEWLILREKLEPSSVHLWRGYSTLQEAKAG